MTTTHSVKTSRASRPTNKPAKGVHVLFSVPNKKKRKWGVITQVNTQTFGGTTYNVTQPSTGDNYTIKGTQIVRCAEPGEVFTLTHK